MIESTEAKTLTSRVLTNILLHLKCYKNNSPRFIKAVEPEELNWNNIGFSRATRSKSHRKTVYCLGIVYLALTYYAFCYFSLKHLASKKLSKTWPLAAKVLEGYLPTVLTVIVTNMSSKALERYEKKELHLRKKEYFNVKVSRLVFIQAYSWLLIFIAEFSAVLEDGEVVDKVPKILYSAMKYTLVKCILEPFLSVVDLAYFYKIFKGKKILRKLTLAKEDKKFDESERECENKSKRNLGSCYYEFLPSSVIRRMTIKPELCLEKKYSKLISVLLIDYMVFYMTYTFLSPFISITFMIFQYLTDTWLLVKRFSKSDPGCGVLSRNAVLLLGMFPKIYIANSLVLYLISFKNFEFWSFWMYLTDFFLSLTLFLPFPWLSKVVYNRWFSLKGEGAEKEYRDVCHLFEVDYEMKKTMAM